MNINIILELKVITVQSTGEHMTKLLVVLALFWSSLAYADVINLEFKFTPYVGDPIKSNQVETVSGKARVFINNVMLTGQEVRQEKVPVLFEEREIAPSVWITGNSLGAALRKGKNILRIEFNPNNAQRSYNARLGWLYVSDQSTEKSDGGRYSSTNQTGTGLEDKEATGNVVLQHEFIADFVTDLPWHHYPAVISLSDEDRKNLAHLVTKRVETFKPPFAGLYEILGKNPNMNLADLKKAKCIDKAYAAGIRINVPAQNQLDFTMSGNQEVVVSRKDSAPLYPFNEKSFTKIKGDEMQMCAAMALSVAYPPRFVVVRSPAGGWEVVY